MQKIISTERLPIKMWLDVPEETASAYEDISQVIAFQSDLVKIKVELSPLAVIKG